MRDRSKTGLVSESHVRVVVSDQVLGQAFLRFLKLDAAGGRIVRAGAAVHVLRVRVLASAYSRASLDR